MKVKRRWDPEVGKKSRQRCQVCESTRRELTRVKIGDRNAKLCDRCKSSLLKLANRGMSRYEALSSLLEV